MNMACRIFRVDTANHTQLQSSISLKPVTRRQYFSCPLNGDMQTCMLATSDICAVLTSS